MQHLPFGSTLEAYAQQAATLLNDWQNGDPGAIQLVRSNHPRFLDERIPWLPKQLSEAEIRSVPLTPDDTQLALARWYSFRDWPTLAHWVQAVHADGSPVARFEAAVEAVISGNTAILEQLLRQDPGLVRLRSTIVTHHDPPEHRATLLHYIAANGVEGWRQKTPKNAVEIARVLLRAGSEPDALAGMYGGECTAMSMLVSSSPPAKAGVQVELANALIDFGAAVDGRGSGAWVSPLMTALVFGFRDTAEALARRGASIDTLAAAAGLGRTEAARQLLATADPLMRRRAFALAAQHGHVAILRLLLDAGEDPNRYNPEHQHSHSTALHQAAWAGHLDTVKFLVERGARLDIRDTVWQGTPLGWAEHGGKTEIAEYLRRRSDVA